MNTEIKVRAWLKELDKMIPADQILGLVREPINSEMDHDLILKYSHLPLGKDYTIEEENSENYILTKCTFFKDKNGKDIYGGDIVKDGSIEYPYLQEVYWDDRYQWSCRLLINNQFSGSLHNDKYVVPQDMRIEVIGNIYENPELLNKIT